MTIKAKKWKFWKIPEFILNVILLLKQPLYFNLRAKTLALSIEKHELVLGSMNWSFFNKFHLRWLNIKGVDIPIPYLDNFCLDIFEPSKLKPTLFTRYEKIYIEWFFRSLLYRKNHVVCIVIIWRFNNNFLTFYILQILYLKILNR